MSDPTQTMPAAGGPDEPEEESSLDRRVIILGSLAALIVVLLIALLAVNSGDDDDDVSATSTTSSSSTTTTSTTTTSTSTSTTTSSTTTSTTTTSTTTSSTAPAPPPPTIAPARCTGETEPDDPEPVAVVFYDAWTIGDRDCAEKVADDEAVDTLFALDGADNEWVFQGCFEQDLPDPHTDCAYTYPGGSAHFRMNHGAIDGWEIYEVEFVAD